MKVGTIQLQRETRERLKDAGTKRETYDDVINRLLDFWETNRGSTYFAAVG